MEYMNEQANYSEWKNIFLGAYSLDCLASLTYSKNK